MTFPSFDSELLLWFNQGGNVFLDSIMLRLSCVGSWVLMLLAVLVVVFRNRPAKEALLILLGMALCVLLADQISASVIKPWVCRLRPTHDPLLMFQVRAIEGRGGLYGFVSSHATNVFSIAMYLSLVFRHRLTTLCMFMWAILVGISRIYLAKHFPLDVLCGAALGMLIGMVVYLLLRFVITRVQKSAKQYYSTTYTSSGFLCQDMYIILASVALTLLYVIF